MPTQPSTLRGDACAPAVAVAAKPPANARPAGRIGSRATGVPVRAPPPAAAVDDGWDSLEAFKQCNVGRPSAPGGLSARRSEGNGSLGRLGSGHANQLGVSAPAPDRPRPAYRGVGAPAASGLAGPRSARGEGRPRGMGGKEAASGVLTGLTSSTPCLPSAPAALAAAPVRAAPAQPPGGQHAPGGSAPNRCAPAPWHAPAPDEASWGAAVDTSPPSEEGVLALTPRGTRCAPVVVELYTWHAPRATAASVVVGVVYTWHAATNMLLCRVGHVAQAAAGHSRHVGRSVLRRPLRASAIRRRGRADHPSRGEPALVVLRTRIMKGAPIAPAEVSLLLLLCPRHTRT